MVVHFFSLASAKKVRSSAKKRWEIFGPFLLLAMGFHTHDEYVGREGVPLCYSSSRFESKGFAPIDQHKNSGEGYTRQN